MPDAFITDLLDAAAKQDTAFVKDYLAGNLSGRKARRLIEKLRVIESVVDPTGAELLALVIAECGQNIPNSPVLFSFAEPPAQAAILISHLLRRISDRTKRTAAAKRVMEAADPLWFGAECLSWLYVTDKPEKQDSNTLTKEEEEAVRKVLVERIKARAAAGAPLFDPDVPQERMLLFEWWRAEGRDPVQGHLVDVFTKEPMQVARFLQSQAPLSWGEDHVLPRVSELDGNQLKNIKLVIDLDVMAEWIRKHSPGDFDNRDCFPDESKPLEKRLTEQFMFVYNKWQKEGEPPDAEVNDAHSSDPEPHIDAENAIAD